MIFQSSIVFCYIICDCEQPGINFKLQLFVSWLGHCWPLFCWDLHTASSDTIFVQIYIDALQGVPAECVKKSDFFILQIKLLSFCAKIAPKRRKLQKTVKIEKKRMMQVQVKTQNFFNPDPWLMWS